MLGDFLSFVIHTSFLGQDRFDIPLYGTVHIRKQWLIHIANKVEFFIGVFQLATPVEKTVETAKIPAAVFQAFQNIFLVKIKHLGKIIQINDIFDPSEYFIAGNRRNLVGIIWAGATPRKSSLSTSYILVGGIGRFTSISIENRTSPVSLSASSKPADQPSPYIL